MFRLNNFNVSDAWTFLLIFYSFWSISHQFFRLLQKLTVKLVWTPGIESRTDHIIWTHIVTLNINIYVTVLFQVTFVRFQFRHIDGVWGRMGSLDHACLHCCSWSVLWFFHLVVGEKYHLVWMVGSITIFDSWGWESEVHCWSVLGGSFGDGWALGWFQGYFYVLSKHFLCSGICSIF